MPSPDSKSRAEIVDLIESQLDTLEKEAFGVVTDAELCEYEGRRNRICQLYDQVLIELPPRDHLSNSRVVCCGVLGRRQSAEIIFTKLDRRWRWRRGDGSNV